MHIPALMHSVWQQITLSHLPLAQWLNVSYLHRLVGALQSWQRGSWVMQWADPMAALLVSLVFGFAPFVSTTLIGLLSVACIAFWVLLTLSDPIKAGHVTTGFTPIHLVALVYWGVAVLATVLSPVKRAALSGLAYTTLYLLLFVVMARVLRSPRLRSWLITLYLHIALVVSAYGLRQQRFGAEQLATWVDPESPLSKNTRVYSYLGNPNLLGGYLLAAIAFSVVAIFIWRGWGPKLLAALMTGIHVACLYYTGSRGAWIGLIFLVVALLLLFWTWWHHYLPRFWRTWGLPLVLGGLAGLLVLAVVMVEPLRLRVTSIFAGRNDSSNNFRLNVWAAAQEMFQAYPISGIGPGHAAFNKMYPIYQRPRYTALSAYSIFLEHLVEMGAIGFTAFLWLLAVIVNQGWLHLQRLSQRRSREAFWLMGALATLAGMLGHGLVDTVWYRPQIHTLWWLSVAVVASYYVSQPEPEADPAAISDP